MSPTPPTVLIDGSFIDALTDIAHEHHARIVACYRSMLDDYEANRIRLRARTDVIGAQRSPLLAPVERIHIAGQHRRAAARLVKRLATNPAIDLTIDEDAALSLVLMRREGITRIATLDPTFDAFELTLLPAA